MSIECQHGQLARVCEICERDTRIAELEAANKELLDGVATLGQALAWREFGECRSFGSATPILNARDADALAKELIAKHGGAA